MNIDLQMTMWMKLKRSILLFFYRRKSKVHVFEKQKTKFRQVTTFSDALKLTLTVGQMFSLNPVSGIRHSSASKIKFNWISWRSLYSLLSICGQTFITIMCAYRMHQSELTLEEAKYFRQSYINIATIIFYGTSCVTMIIFLRIAIRWPRLCRFVTSTESTDPYFDRGVIYKCNVACVVVLSLALIEHILSVIAGFVGALKCDPDSVVYESFVKHFYPWVFDFMPYSMTLGLMTQLLHIQSTFIWNFSDIFVICTSYYLTSRLDHVNKKLNKAHRKYLPETFWKVTREDYSRVTEVIRQVDDVINGVVFISFANNLFFVCSQLFNTLERGINESIDCPHSKGKVASWAPLKGYEQAAYFLFSLVFLITRSIAVSLIASQVNSASMVPAPVLYDVPSPVFCVEVQRFLEQVNSDDVALTGLQFFSVTRGLLLSVAGTIATYELVMLQFSTSPSTSSTTTATPLSG